MQMMEDPVMLAIIGGVVVIALTTFIFIQSNKSSKELAEPLLKETLSASNFDPPTQTQPLKAPTPTTIDETPISVEKKKKPRPNRPKKKNRALKDQIQEEIELYEEEEEEDDHHFQILKASDRKSINNKKSVKPQAVAPTPVVLESVSVSVEISVETPVAEETKGKKGKSQSPVPEPVTPPSTTTPSTSEGFPEESMGGWAVVQKKPSKKLTSSSAGEVEEGEESSDDTPAAPEKNRETIHIEAKKIGLLIGPKGVTKIAIQNLAQVEIQIPKEKDSSASSSASSGDVVITLVGSVEGVELARTIIAELMVKKYSPLLEGEDFIESEVIVHSSFLPDIVGKSGACVKAIQDHAKVRITIPNSSENSSSGSSSNLVRIGVAGQRVAVAVAESLIRDLITKYYTPVTHPGHSHLEMDVPSSLYHAIIGVRGSEIKNIQQTYHCSLHLPSTESINKKLVIVANDLKNLENARKHIQKMIDLVEKDKDAAINANKSWTATVPLPTPPTSPLTPLSPVAPGKKGKAGGGGGAGAVPHSPVSPPPALPLPLPMADPKDPWSVIDFSSAEGW